MSCLDINLKRVDGYLADFSQGWGSPEGSTPMHSQAATLTLLCERWEEARRRGENITPEELCRDHPALVADVRRAIRNLAAADGLATSPASIPETRPAVGVDQPLRDDAGLPAKAAVTAPGAVMPCQPEPAEGGRLGPYRLLGVLGRGGMGVVFRAEDPVLKRLVALKVMNARLAANSMAKARFVREAQAQAAVEHDNITPIFQIGGEDTDTPFIAMPLLKGETLAAALGKDPHPPLRRAVRIGREIAEGLFAAHATGLVHRDIKPANVWLEGDHGRVRILDFGLARAVAGDPAAGTGEADTAEGLVVGTPPYMSPQQARGERVDARTDLFSLGVVLYQMCTGRLPFAAASLTGLLLSITTDRPVPPAEIVPDVPVPLSTLILRLLEKDPDSRPGSARQVADDLLAIENALSAAIPVSIVPVGPEPGAPNGDPWSSIGETETGCSLRGVEGTTERADEPRSRGAVYWWAAGLVVLSAAAGVLGLVLRQHPPRGRLVIDADDANWAVVIKQDRGIVIGPTMDREFMLPPGHYIVEGVTQDQQGKAKPERVTLDANGVETVHLRDVKPGHVRAQPKAPPLPDPNRKAAEALCPHAQLTLDVGGERPFVVNPGSGLPAGPFVVTTVFFVQHQPMVSEEIARTCLAAIAGLQGTEEVLDLEGRLSADGEWLATLAKSPAAQSLRKLNLAGLSVGDLDIPVLKSFPRLVELRVNAARMTDAGVSRLAELDKLVDLGLLFFGKSGRISPRGYETLTRLPVKGLTLGHAVGIDDSFLRLLSTNAKDLKTLNLYCSDVVDKAFPDTKPPRNLESLCLDRTRVGDDGLGHLHRWKRLKKLVVTGCKVTRIGVDEVSKALPRCVIEWDRGTIDPDRDVANTLNRYADLKLRLASGREADISMSDPLPAEPFVIIWITYTWRSPVRSNHVPDILLHCIHKLSSVDGLTDRHFILRNWSDEYVEQFAESVRGTNFYGISTNVKLTRKNLTSLSGIPKLAQISFDCAEADDELFEAIGDMLPRVTNLHLHRVGTTRILSERACQAITRRQIDALFLNKVTLTPQFARRIATMPKLFELRLYECRFESGSLEEVVRSPTMAILRLDYNTRAVTDEVIANLANSLHVKEFSVAQTKVTATGVERLAAAKPQMRIVWDGGAIEPK